MTRQQRLAKIIAQIAYRRLKKMEVKNERNQDIQLQRS